MLLLEMDKIWNIDSHILIIFLLLYAHAHAHTLYKHLHVYKIQNKSITYGGAMQLHQIIWYLNLQLCQSDDFWYKKHFWPLISSYVKYGW